MLYDDRHNDVRRIPAALTADDGRELAGTWFEPTGTPVGAVLVAPAMATPAAYYAAFYQAALRARRSITLLAWDFNSQTRLHFDPVPKGGPPALLGDFLNYLVRRRRGLHIHVLNWD